MFQFQKRKCTSDTFGIITKVFFNDNGSRRVTVEYMAFGKNYVIKENITVKSVPIFKMGIPVGQRKIEYVKEGLGEKVKVCFDPDNPKKAYLKDNIGKHV